MTMPPDTEPERPVRLLRGRVMIRPLVEEKSHGGILIPETARDARTNKNTLGRGVVVMMGPPAWNKANTAIVEPGFEVGDLVLHVGQHVSRKVVWNGEELRMCSQEEVCGVIE